jgi:hypothetical protein
MRTLIHEIPVSIDNPEVYLVYLTDTHVGARACAEELLQSDVAKIAEHPNTYWIHGGDTIECIANVGDKRYDERTIAPWMYGKRDVIKTQVKRFLKMFKPIARKNLGLVKGNHEQAAEKYYGRDVYEDIVSAMAKASGRKTPELELGYQGFVWLRFVDKENGNLIWEWKLYCNHGYGGGRLPGGHALALGRALGDYENIDFVAMGHRHVRVYVDKSLASPAEDGTVNLNLRQALFVPSYLNAYVEVSSKNRPVDTYPESLGLPPQHLGSVPIRINPFTKEVKVVLSNKQGLELE